MRTLANTKREPGIWMSEAPKPEVGPNDVLIRIRKTAICGTDMHIFNWDEWAQKTIPVPMHVGHEYVGTVEAMGAEVRGLKIGQRVSGAGPIGIMAAAICRHVGARHVVITDVNDYRLELAKKMGAHRTVNIAREK